VRDEPASQNAPRSSSTRPTRRPRRRACRTGS